MVESESIHEFRNTITFEEIKILVTKTIKGVLPKQNKQTCSKVRKRRLYRLKRNRKNVWRNATILINQPELN